jgi:4-hydroxy-tetrahydrodipicolinate synthase
MQLSGCGTALITPFRGDGSVDEEALVSLVRWQVESGVSFLVVCGTTGEAPTLSLDETLRVVELTIEAAAGRAPVLAGCTHNSTREAVARVRRISRVPNLSGIMSANPYYNKPTQEGQFQHFKAIANATDLPVMLYNIPPRTAANLEPATTARLADEVRNIVAIKEASGSMSQVMELITMVPKNFQVFSGEDNLALPVIAVGGAGVIAVASNEIPAEMSQMVKAALANDWQTARRLQHRFFTLMQANFWESNPGPVKCLLAMMGRITESYRLPMVPVQAGTRARLAKLADELGLLTGGLREQGDLRVS